MTYDLATRPTVNLRNPIGRELPPNGTNLELPDGRQGYIAGAARLGKLIFVVKDAWGHETQEVWPADLRGWRMI